MDKVQIPDGGVDQRLKGGRAHALYQAGPEEARVVLAGSAGPGAGHDEDAGTQDEEVPLAPDAARGHEEDGGEAAAEQEVARQQSHRGEAHLEPHRQRQGVGSEDGAQRRGEDSRHREHKGDEIALPQRPVQRVVRVV